MLLLEARVGSTLNLMTVQEAADELLDHAALEHARVVLVHSHEQVAVHLVELLNVNQDVREILDGLLVVHDEILVATIHLVRGILLEVWVPEDAVLGITLLGLFGCAQCAFAVHSRNLAEGKY